MSFDEQAKKVVRAPCARCMALRFFILGVLTIIVIWQVSPDSLAIVAQISPVTGALCAVGALAFIAIAKTLFEWFEMRSAQDPTE